MTLTVLVDNVAKDAFGAEHGLSFHVQHNGCQLLFDTGHSDLFLRNAKACHINLDNLSTIVLSHGHWDHGNGLEYVSDKRLICHPSVFTKRYRNGEQENIGLSLNKETIEKQFRVVARRRPYYLDQDVLFLGEIPRIHSFEHTPFNYHNEKGETDAIPDDSALVLIDHGELIILSGCAHSGICNIISYAQSITGIRKIKAVFGGFHLKHDDERLQATIEFFRKRKIKNIYPSHCTQLPAMTKFRSLLGAKQLKAGMQINLN